MMDRGETMGEGVNVITRNGEQRVLLVANYSSIEPLGLLHLAGLARDEGWERKIHLVRNDDFGELNSLVEDYKPDIIGANIYTGWQLQAGEALRKIKQDKGDKVAIIVGGPYPTYSPVEASDFADFVVMREGFGPFRKILNGEVRPGILTMDSPERFPQPDRATFYADYPEHATSGIKSLITMTGCPFACTYCYNSSTLADINLEPKLAKMVANSLKTGERLFPNNIRSIDDVIQEGREIAERWPTKVIYFQDDIFGFDVKSGGVLEQMASRWSSEVGIPFHAQMRWEMTKGDQGDRRLELTRKAGGFGLTLAIEAADPTVRAEILDRGMPDELVEEGVIKVVDKYGFKLRTEQISGLPIGTTSIQTEINLDADVALLGYNINLMESTRHGRENMMAWASTFAPYVGTKLGNFALEQGFYEDIHNGDVPDSFFEHSVLRFLKEWVPEIGEIRKERDKIRNKSDSRRIELDVRYEELTRALREDDSKWLSAEENEIYRRQNGEYRKKFSFFFGIPNGHELARNYLSNMQDPYSYKRLGLETEVHLMRSQHSHPVASFMLEDINRMRVLAVELTHNDGERKLALDLAPYFGSLPHGEESFKRYLNYARERGYTASSLSDATRHSLYDDLLYKTDNPS